MQKLYKDRDWLYVNYRIKKLSPRQIGEIIEVNHNTIWLWLYKFNFSIRSNAEARHLTKGNHCQLSQEAKEWLDGELLGDGGIYSQSSYSARIGYGSKYLEYIEYVSDILTSFGIKQAGKISKKYHKDMNCYTYKYTSLDYEEFLPIRKRWYPEGKKIVPRDIELTPLTCRQWYIGDGCLEHQKKGRSYITLSTNAFPVADVGWLTNELIKLGFKTKKQLSNNTIHVSTHSTKDFLDYIGKCPIDCYQYKWNY